MQTIADYMSKNVLFADSMISVLNAVCLMREKKVSSLLINEGDRTVGIFTERDLLNKVDFASPEGVHSLSIKTVMTRNPKTVDHTEPYLNVIQKMKELKIRHIPITGDGKIIGIVSLRDLLNSYQEHLEYELKLRESQLQKDINIIRNSEKKFRMLFDNSPVAITLADKDEQIIAWNPFAANLLGMTDEDLFGKPIKELYSSREWKNIRSQNIRQLGMKHHMETKVLNKKGDEIDVDISISVLKDASGNITGSIGIMRDVSERKEVEYALLRAKEEAEAASRAKTNFLASISHEVRTPMNAIIGLVDLVMETKLTNEQRDNLITVKASADHLMNLLNDVLDFAKIESGRIDLEKIDFDLRAAIDTATKGFVYKAFSKGLQFLVNVNPNVPDALIGDPGRLRQVISNLANNAVKFTEKGKIFLDVEMESRAEDKVSITFAVKDTGIGIRRDKLKAIFDEFSQADISTFRKYGGTGLGLSISKKIVELMNSRIVVESKIGQGATFSFTVSFKVQKGKKEVPMPKINLEGTRVLVVDDNRINQYIMNAMLSNFGMKIQTASDAKEGMSRLIRARGKIKLMILDVNMPVTDGFQFAKQLRCDKRFRDLKIIILSSEGQRGDAKTCKELGISAYLLKPADQNQLVSAIKYILGGVELPDKLITRHTIRESQYKLNLLVVDDNDINRKLVIKLCEKRGWNVKPAANGKEAVDILDKEKFDVVLMDVEMPVMDGCEATKMIREKEKKKNEHTLIVALTAHAFESEQKDYLDSGMDDVIVKPIRADQFFNTIEKQVSASQSEKLHALDKTSALPDKRRIIDELSLNEEIFNELLGDFIAQTEGSIKRLDKAMEEKDFSEIEKIGHFIKGSSGNLRIEKMYEAAASIEELARGNKDIHAIEVNSAALKRVLDKIKAECVK